MLTKNKASVFLTEEEIIVPIRVTESELSCLVWALTVIKTIRLPVDPEWKTPYKALLKDLKKIGDDLLEEKTDRINDQREEKSRFNVDVEEEIQKSQGNLVAGCKGGDCD